MAFFPIYRYRLYDDPSDQFFGDQLDLFDPWNDLRDTSSSATPTVLIAPKSFRWINEPKQNQNSHPQKPQRSEPHPQKIRLQLNLAGYNPETINTKVENGKVIVEGKQEEKQDDGDFNIRQFRKSYPLPENADAEHLTSYVTPNHMLMIEVPIKKPKPEPKKDHQQQMTQFGEHRDPLFDYGGFLRSADFQPKIVDKENNQKQLEMCVEMKNYRPDEIKVSVKNDELIIKGEHRNTDGQHYERSFFYKSTKLPPGTQIEQIQSSLTDDGHLNIAVPFVPQTEQQQLQQTEHAQPTKQTEQAQTTQQVNSAHPTEQKNPTQQQSEQTQSTEPNPSTERTQTTEEQKQ